ncbi:M4 family metallopeptidase [Segeticoccus rhizosphaerae]|jgi:Zn-dependent metalloprotease|uniref:M4 family metallopeptidase n=1 Tax=Segeticoccus rhizosphaerae TaxID=1104777 RepID=UPI0010C0F8C7|nr:MULTISPECIES: M4 family metallopeptidase [Intrasporangiaceae]
MDTATEHSAACSIMPPYLLEQLAKHEDPRVAEAAKHTLLHERTVRNRREIRAARSRPDRRPSSGLIPPDLQSTAQRSLPTQERPAPTQEPPATTTEPAPDRTVYDAEQGTDLPGTQVRDEGQAAVPDESVNEAYDGLGDTWTLYWTSYQRNSLDNEGLPLIASVHYEKDFDNAFWDGEQMVFGDGDGVYFRSFTDSVDVIGHELTHGVTQYTAGLTYVGQSGALNESVSDVFGSLVKQMKLGQTADQADWLIGEGLFTDKVHGVALRSMKAPGTAYDDPHLGKDPQPATMDGYVDLPHDQQHDNGGVHTNSGIPNHAFYLAAVAIGGEAWKAPGQIWYDVLTGGKIAKDVDFAGFAAATIDAATARFGADSSQTKAVHDAWLQVKVLTE